MEGIENEVGKSEIGFRGLPFILLLFVRPGPALLPFFYIFKVTLHAAAKT